MRVLKGKKILCEEAETSSVRGSVKLNGLWEANKDAGAKKLLGSGEAITNRTIAKGMLRYLKGYENILSR